MAAFVQMTSKYISEKSWDQYLQWDDIDCLPNDSSAFLWKSWNSELQTEKTPVYNYFISLLQQSCIYDHGCGNDMKVFYSLLD